jgi:hypothetical protein
LVTASTVESLLQNDFKEATVTLQETFDASKCGNQLSDVSIALIA